MNVPFIQLMARKSRVMDTFCKRGIFDENFLMFRKNSALATFNNELRKMNWEAFRLFTEKAEDAG